MGEPLMIIEASRNNRLYTYTIYLHAPTGDNCISATVEVTFDSKRTQLSSIQQPWGSNLAHFPFTVFGYIEQRKLKIEKVTYPPLRGQL